MINIRWNNNYLRCPKGMFLVHGTFTSRRVVAVVCKQRTKYTNPVRKLLFRRIDIKVKSLLSYYLSYMVINSRGVSDRWSIVVCKQIRRNRWVLKYPEWMITFAVVEMQIRNKSFLRKTKRFSAHSKTVIKRSKYPNTYGFK